MNIGLSLCPLPPLFHLFFLPSRLFQNPAYPHALKVRQILSSLQQCLFSLLLIALLFLHSITVPLQGGIGPDLFRRDMGGTGTNVKPLTYEPTLGTAFPRIGEIDSFNFEHVMEAKEA